MSAKLEAFIGLGSNQQAPQQQLQTALRALAALPDTELVACSSFYRSAPVGPQDQPDFINAVAQLATALSPLALLDHLQTIEQQQGRVRDQYWGPRTLDLDLLLYGEQVIDHPRLQVPHPHMWERAFVLRPLAELLAELQPPLKMLHTQSLDERLAACASQAIERLEPEQALSTHKQVSKS